MRNFCLVLICLFMNVSWGQDNTTTIYLIRHAEKTNISSDPELSEAGKARADKWAVYFKDKHIAAVYSTPYKRTAATAQAVASSAGQPVIKYDPEEMDLTALAAKFPGKSILIVGHSNTIPAYINRLIGENAYRNIDESVYSNVYVIKISGNSVSHELTEVR